MEYKKWISNYNSNEYKEYVKNLSIYNMYKGKILKKINKSSNDISDKYNYNETKNNYFVKYNDIEIDIKKPIYKNIQNELEIEIEKKENLLIEYKILKSKILLNDNKDVLGEYNKLINKLKKIDNYINNIIEYYIKINVDIKKDININKIKIDELEKEKKELYLDFLKTNSKIDQKIYIEKYFDLVKRENLLKNKNIKLINYFILELPSVSYKNESKIKIPTVKTKEVKVKKDLKLDDKIKELNKKIKKELEKEIEKVGEDKLKNKIDKDMFIEFLKLFKFDNEDDCSETYYGYDHFMKKNEIVKIIKNNPEIFKVMPKGFATKKKEEICKMLFNLV